MITTPSELTDYCIVCNEVARRKDLSARAKGIYYYLATLPKDWDLSQEDLITRFSEGRTAITTAFKELVTTGYIDKKRKQGKGGLFEGYSYKVKWTCRKPVNQKTENGLTENGKSNTTNYLNKLNTKEIINKKDITKVISKKDDDLLKDKFEKFWTLYDRKVGKEKAFLQFKKLNEKEIELAIFNSLEYSKATEKQFRKHPERWLRDKCFNDEILKTEENSRQLPDFNKMTEAQYISYLEKCFPKMLFGKIANKYDAQHCFDQSKFISKGVNGMLVGLSSRKQFYWNCYNHRKDLEMFKKKEI